MVKVRRKFAIIFIWVIAFFAVSPVFAAVYTEKSMNLSNDGIYVAGNNDFYPIEYYSRETGMFEGVMPEILKDISERIDIDFYYIYDTVHTQTEVATEHQADIVSAYMVEINEKFEKDDIEILTYEYNGKMTNVGLAFTEELDEDIAELIKSAVGTLTEEEIKGYLVAESKKSKDDVNQGLFLIVTCIVLFVLAALVVLYFKMLEVKINKNRVTDADTGIGNIAYFEKAFVREIF